MAAVALAVHARTIAFGLTGLDDRDLVVGDHAFLADPRSLLQVFGRSYLHVVDASHAYWRPVVTASYVLDAQWSGERAAGFHATNVVLNAVASVLVLAMLRRFGVGRTLAFAGALVFAVHPALAEAVAWIPGRNDLLLAVLSLGAWLCLRRGKVTAHLVLFGLALMTKETALALPMIWVAERGLRGTLRRPWLLAAWTALVVARVLAHPAAPHGTADELLANVAVFPAALAAIALPVKPVVLGVVGDLPVVPGLAVAVVVGLVAWKARGVRRRAVAAGAVAFAFLLAPSAVVPGTLVLACRFVLPAFGVLVVAAELARAASIERRAVAAFGGVVVTALALLTVSFEGAFHDERAFAREAVDDAPRSPLAHVCLGQVYQRAGEDDRALAEYRAALAEGPAEVAHNDMAVIAMKRALWPDAERELRAELAVNPGWATPYANLAIVLRRQERPAEACEAARRAIALGRDDDAGGAEAARDCGGP
ncbi:MAG TPA: hypothetical protein VGG39_18355 [Polyangiaceae bacterium]